MRRLKIRPIKESELAVVKKSLKDSAPHEFRFSQQESGEGPWLIGWIGKEPVAHLYLNFQGDKTKKVRKNLAQCPHISNLGVQEKLRRKGIASKMLLFAEGLVMKKGFKKVGLAVEYGNNFLRDLYQRRGYNDWGDGTIVDTWKEKGKLRRKKCWYLIKKLKK
jgi:GNAT superfamily N-acetyltransferase